MLTFLNWLKEDAPTNCSASPHVRGFGDTSGTPNGTPVGYVPANLADADTRSSQLFKAVTQHLGMHGHTTSLSPNHHTINIHNAKGIKAPKGTRLPGEENHLIAQ